MHVYLHISNSQFVRCRKEEEKKTTCAKFRAATINRGNWSIQIRSFEFIMPIKKLIEWNSRQMTRFNVLFWHFFISKIPNKYRNGVFFSFAYRNQKKWRKRRYNGTFFMKPHKWCLSQNSMIYLVIELFVRKMPKKWSNKVTFREWTHR